MLNFYAHFLSRRTKFTAFTDVIVTIFTNLAEQDLFLCKVPKIAFGLQQRYKFGTKSKASGSCAWCPSLIVAVLLDHHLYWCFTWVLLADFSEADQKAVKCKLLCWQIKMGTMEKRGVGESNSEQPRWPVLHQGSWHWGGRLSMPQQRSEIQLSYWRN